MYLINKISAGAFSGAVTSSRELLVWGSGDFGIFMQPQKVVLENLKFVDLKISKQNESFAAAVDDQGLLYSWGSNPNGQLGHGDYNIKSVPTKVNQLRKKQVNFLAVGGQFVVALGKDCPPGSQKRKKDATPNTTFTEN
jgi:X-linked retinitis pigmentosa GTPase regulator